MHQNERRLFLRNLALGVITVVAAPSLTLRRAMAADLVKDSDPLVKALMYVPVAKDSKTRKDPKAFCSGCQFYSETDSKAKRGKCQLIASGEVQAGGYCNSYSPKVAKK